jgi:predicted nucleotidyltransferase
MAKRTYTREEMIEEVKSFMRRVGVEQAILYGSRARGDNLKSSDVDMILISPQFEGIRFIDRLPPLHRAWHIPELFPEVLAYTPEEFEQAQEYLGIEREAARTGIRVTLSGDG